MDQELAGLIEIARLLDQLWPASRFLIRIAMALPFTPVAVWFGFVAPPLQVIGALWLVVIAYLILAELLKKTAIKQAVMRGAQPINDDRCRNARIRLRGSAA